MNKVMRQDMLDTVRMQRMMEFLKIGMRVKYTYGGCDLMGAIKGGNIQGNLDIVMDGCKKAANYHPTFCLVYYDEAGDIIKEYGE